MSGRLSSLRRRLGTALRLALLLVVACASLRASAGKVAGLERLPPTVRAFLANLKPPPPGKKLVAVFDHDDTLVHGDLGGSFMRWMLRKGHFPDEAPMRKAHAAHRWLNGSGIAGLKLSRFQALVSRYYAVGFGGFHTRIYTPQQILIEELHRRGVEVHIVSASNVWLVRETAKHLGIPEGRVHGMEFVVKDGVITDELVAPIPWAKEKVRALESAQVLKDGVVVFASGDSKGDLNLLELAAASGMAMTVNDHRKADVANAAVQHGYTRAKLGHLDTIGAAQSVAP